MLLLVIDDVEHRGVTGVASAVGVDVVAGIGDGVCVQVVLHGGDSDVEVSFEHHCYTLCKDIHRLRAFVLYFSFSFSSHHPIFRLSNGLTQNPRVESKALFVPPFSAQASLSEFNLLPDP
jgi:hypothetical protein